MISKTKMVNLAKELMKQHPVMDGSGHLYLRDPKGLSEEQIEDVICFVHKGLTAQGIDDEPASTVDSLIEGTLRQIARRRPPREKRARTAKRRGEAQIVEMQRQMLEMQRQMIEMQKQIGNLAKKKT